MKAIDELLEAPYWIIDILPGQVPKDSLGQYFAVAEYYLEDSELVKIKQKHINVILKLNCYKDISIDEEQESNPAPKRIAEEMRKRYLYIRVDDAMILSEPDDTHMTIFNAGDKLLSLIKVLAAGEGLFVWKPPVESEGH